MKKQKKSKNLLLWIARSLVIALTIFLSLFSLDTPFGLGFLIHNIPSIILIILLIVTWKNPKIASINYLILAIITTIFFSTYKELTTFLTLSLPLLIISLLMWFSKNKK